MPNISELNMKTKLMQLFPDWKKVQVTDETISSIFLLNLLQVIKDENWWYELARVEFSNGIFIRAKISKSGVFPPSDCFTGKAETELEALGTAYLKATNQYEERV